MNELLTSKPVCRVDLLMNKLKEFYKNEEHIDTLINIVSGNSEIALRDIDWLCTNYSKKYNVIYNIKEEKNEEIINKRFILYINYRSQLKAYTKEFFDPFCRRDRIEFVYKDNKSLITTVGQLNFFRWALTYKVIDYVHNNLKDIKKDNTSVIKKKKLIEESNKDLIQKDKHNEEKQNNSIDNNKDKYNSNESSESNEKKRRKRHQLSISAVRTINKQNVSIIVNFESKSKNDNEKINNIANKINENNKVSEDNNKDNIDEKNDKNVKIKQLHLKDKININRRKNKKNNDKEIKEKEEKSLIDYYCKKVVPTAIFENQLFS